MVSSSSNSSVTFGPSASERAFLWAITFARKAPRARAYASSVIRSSAVNGIWVTFCCSPSVSTPVCYSP
jgi:hypothetical protein